MKVLLEHLKPFRLQLGLGPLFKLVEAVIELATPLLMARIIDEGIRGQDRPLIWRLGALILALTVVGVAFSFLTQYMASVASQGTGTRLRRAVFERAIRLDEAGGDAMGTVSLTNRLTSDINQIQLAVAMTIRLLTRAPFLAIGGVIMSFSISPRLSLLLLAAVPLAALLLWFLMRQAIRIFRRVQRQLDRVAGRVRDHLAGVRVIRAFGREADERVRFASANEQLRRLVQWGATVSALMNPVTQLIFNAAIVLVLWRGAGAVNTGEVTQGQMLALTNYLGQIVLAMMVVANLVLLFPRAFAAAGRVSETLNTPPALASAEAPAAPLATHGAGDGQPAEGTPLLRCESLGFRFPGAQDALLTDLNFSLEAGETLGVIGATGAGKSTLLDLLMGFQYPESGRILVRGEELTRERLPAWRDEIAWVSQRAVLLSGTIRSNLGLGLDPAYVSDARCYEALERAQVLELVKGLDGGLDAVVERGGSNFSGGQRQRVAIARALMRPASLLLLDDCFSALDYLTDLRLRQAIAALPQRPAVILVSQRVHQIRGASRILLLDEGRVAGLAPHAELLEHSALYRDIVRSQQGDEVAS